MMLLPILLGSPFCAARSNEGVRLRLANGRILFDTKVDNHPVRLVFDTGATCSVLFRSAADRLGLKVTTANHDVPLSAGEVHIDAAEECVLTLGKASGPAQFGVVDIPSHVRPDIDGLIAWRSLSNAIFQLDVERNICAISDELPPNLESWSKWRVAPDTQLLVFECPNGKEVMKIGIDTGSTQGVWLSPERWQRWRAERAGRPATLDAAWEPAEGLVVREVLRAKKITIGGVTLSDVPVSVATPSSTMLFHHADAIVGFFAFRRLRLVIDGQNGWVYTRPVAYSFERYDYNRLGAVFVPEDPDKTDDLIAQVSEGSPAYRAGVRNGDILLKIGELDATQWRSDTRIRQLIRFQSQPAGTKLKLTLKRNDQRYETMVTLEELPAVE